MNLYTERSEVIAVLCFFANMYTEAKNMLHFTWHYVKMKR